MKYISYKKGVFVTLCIGSSEAVSVGSVPYFSLNPLFPKILSHRVGYRMYSVILIFQLILVGVPLLYIPRLPMDIYQQMYNSLYHRLVPADYLLFLRVPDQDFGGQETLSEGGLCTDALGSDTVDLHPHFQQFVHYAGQP